MSKVKLAESARLIGRVRLEDGSYISQGFVIRSMKTKY